MQTTNPWQANQHTIRQADYKSMIKHENNINSPDSPQENPKKDDWLSSQFNRPLFLLYKSWLALNFVITLILEFVVVKVCWNLYVNLIVGNRIFERMATFLAIDFLFFLYGCCEMLFAMHKRSSRVAQRSVVKFQYNVIGSITSLILLKPVVWTISLQDNSWMICVYGIFSAIIHLIGGLAVLKTFKKNHPLTRPINSQGVSEDLSQDFLQQNEVIGSEIAEYDERLNRWPFIVYGWWLKFVLVFKIWLIFNYTLCDVMVILATEAEILPKDSVFLIELWITFVLNAYSCFRVEAAVRRKSLVKSKKALVLTKICCFLSVVTCLFVIVDISAGGTMSEDDISPGSSSYLFWVVCLVILPVLTLLGAIKVNKIIEQRDQFAKVSNYTNDSYL